MENNILEYKLKKCIVCGAETDSTDKEELFCSKCGAPVVNKCSDYSCGKYLKSDAKFCKYCGSSSVFNNYNLIDPPNNTDELPF